MTKKVLLAAILILAGSILFTTAAAADIAPYINFQGVLNDSGGDPVTATPQMVFQIYDVASGGSPLWTETHPSVSVEAGLFNVVLGSITTFASADLRFDTDYWIGVTVAGDSEMAPRQRLTATGYAFNAQRVYSSLTDGPVISVEVSSSSTKAIYSYASGSGSYAGYFTSEANAVYGEGQSRGGTFYGRNSNATAVEGRATGTTATNVGGYFQALGNPGAKGVVGSVTSSVGGTNYGGYFTGGSASENVGVYGAGRKYGVQGISALDTGSAVYGWATSSSGTNYGGYFWTESSSGRAVYGLADNTSGTNYGGYFQSDSTAGGVGVYGVASGSTGKAVYGQYSGTASGGRGVIGWVSNAGSSARAVYGLSSGTTGYGGYFENASATGWAGYFDGRVSIEGSCHITGDLVVDGSYPGGGGASGNYVVLGTGEAQTTSSTHGVWVESTNASGVGIFAKGLVYGGSFESGSTAGTNIAVSGWTPDSNGTNYGGHFASNSVSGYGVYGRGARSGGTFECTSGSGSAVYGLASNTGTGVNYGGYFQGKSNNGVGVYGAGWEVGGKFEGQNSVGIGVHGVASYAVGGTTYGGYFESKSPAGTGVYASGEANAGYFNGDVHVTGDLTVDGSYPGGGGGAGSVLLGPASVQTTTSAYAIRVESSNASGTGVYGKGLTAGGSFETVNGRAVYGVATYDLDTTVSYGGYFESRNNYGRGVYGLASKASAGPNYGGYFESYATNGSGVYGKAAGSAGSIYGGYFESPNSSAGRGVYASGIRHGLEAKTTTGSAVSAEATNSGGVGVYGVFSGGGSAADVGGRFVSNSTGGHGVEGDAQYKGGYFTITSGGTGAKAVQGNVVSMGSAVTNYGGYFEGYGSQGHGVYGKGYQVGGSFECTTDDMSGVYGFASGALGAGVRGYSQRPTTGFGFGGHFTGNPANSKSVGVYAKGGGYGVSAESWGGKGVYGWSYDGYGVHADSDADYALYVTSDWANTYIARIQGGLYVNGALYKASGSFLIDHPQDPENKILCHSFMESPDMKNVYDGIVTLDENGEAVVDLPSYFEALNKDFRYQLTAVGGYAPVYVKSEIKNNQFVVAGGKPGLKISWLVTGIRNDAYAQKHPMVVEQEKGVGNNFEKGFYIHAEEHGAPPQLSDRYRFDDDYRSQVDEKAASLLTLGPGAAADR